MTGAAPTPPTGHGLRHLVTRAKPALVTTGKVAGGVAITLAVNVLALLIAIPIGFALNQVVWSIAIAELGVLVASLVAGAILALRARRSVGAGVVLGWAVGYVGLIVAVIAFIVAAVVIVAVGWLLFMLFVAAAAVLPG